MSSSNSNADPEKPRKKYIPLESNPEVFTELIQSLGVSGLEFQDVYSLDDDMLGMLPRPVLALVILFPAIGEEYEKGLEQEHSGLPGYEGSGDGEDVIWFKQTIGLACGLYALLHAISNGPARNYISSGSLIQKLLETCTPLNPHERALALEASEGLEKAHALAGKSGATEAPSDLEDDVDYHYACFVRSHKSGRLYELDGMKPGPVDTGVTLTEGEDIISGPALQLVRNFIRREQQRYQNDGFSLMALVRSPDN
ncbi:ubiquitinyl hydrolase 1 [Marasmius crinis-equi]|uniref:Ubiquitin carboxyl-terminal hydrolase n=1 Tax=Marasmius crinis-equi TaxID=585013 RepID=A0ABR3FN92_9AGAR